MDMTESYELQSVSLKGVSFYQKRNMGVFLAFHCRDLDPISLTQDVLLEDVLACRK